MEVNQDGEDPNQQKDIFHKIDEHGSEHLMNVLDIVCQPRHQSPYRIVIEERDGERLKVAEHLYPEVMHGFLTGHFHGVDLKEIQDEMSHEDEYDHQRNMEDPFKISPSQDEKIL